MNPPYSIGKIAHSCENPLIAISSREPTLTENQWRTLGEKLINFQSTPEEIMQWHRMFNPLKEHHEQGGCHVFGTIDVLPTAAATLIAYARGFNAEEYNTTDARNFYRINGTFQRHSRRIYNQSLESNIAEIEVPNFVDMLIENIEAARDENLTSEQIGYMLYAGELLKDVSEIPLSTFPDASSFLRGEPCGERENHRRAAYSCFESVIQIVDKKEETTPEDIYSRLYSAEYLLGMLNKDAYFHQRLHANFSDAYTLSKVDFCAFSHENRYIASNSGFPDFDKNARNLPKILEMRDAHIAHNIERIRECLIDTKIGLVSNTSRAHFKGTAHEAMWLIDSIMWQYINPGENIEITKTLTRQDRNIEALKPIVKSTYDMQASRHIGIPHGQQPPVKSEKLQLKASEHGAQRSQYHDDIRVVFDAIFNDANPRRIAGKLNAYQRIIAGEVSPDEAAMLYKKYALPSVQEYLGLNR